MAADTQAALERMYERRCREIALLADTAEADGDYLHPVFGVGCATPWLLLIGEAPGGEEAAAGCPFVGKAGKQLDELLSLAQISKDDIYVTNVVKYRPVIRSARSVRNRTPSRTEILDGLPLLQIEIQLLVPAVVATLGNTPLTAVLQLAQMPAVTIGACHGQAIPLNAGDTPAKLFPLYHPASGIYNRSLIAVMQADALALSRLCRDNGFSSVRS